MTPAFKFLFHEDVGYRFLKIHVTIKNESVLIPPAFPQLHLAFALYLKCCVIVPNIAFLVGPLWEQVTLTLLSESLWPQRVTQPLSPAKKVSQPALRGPLTSIKMKVVIVLATFPKVLD